MTGESVSFKGDAQGGHIGALQEDMSYSGDTGC